MMLPDAKGTLLSCHIAVKAAVKLSDIRIAIFFLMGQRITNWERNFWDRFGKKNHCAKNIFFHKSIQISSSHDELGYLSHIKRNVKRIGHTKMCKRSSHV